jgi:hypothetical protein
MGSIISRVIGVYTERNISKKDSEENVVSKKFEVKNGLLGVKRDIFLLLVRKVNWIKEKETRNV